MLSSGSFDLIHQFRVEVALNEAWKGHLGDQFDGRRKLSLMTKALPNYNSYASFVPGRRELRLEIARPTTSPAVRHSPWESAMRVASSLGCTRQELKCDAIKWSIPDAAISAAQRQRLQAPTRP